MRYRELGVFYLFAVKDDRAAPSQGHSIDHLGFGPIDLDKVVAALTAEGVTFTSNPNPRLNPGVPLRGGRRRERPAEVRRLYCAEPDQLAHRVVFLDGPGGVRIELRAASRSRRTLRNSKGSVQNAKFRKQGWSLAMAFLPLENFESCI